jgi:hypothetical protein
LAAAAADAITVIGIAIAARAARRAIAQEPGRSSGDLMMW